MFEKYCPHCNEPKMVFLAKEFNQRDKVKTCAACDKTFTVKMDYKQFALFGMATLVGVAALLLFIFGESTIVSIVGGIAGYLVGHASATSLEPISSGTPSE